MVRHARPRDGEETDMRSGICTKCGANEVRCVPQPSVEVSIAITWMSTAGIEYLVCTQCGHVELYVRDKQLLPKIAEKYPKV